MTFARFTISLLAPLAAGSCLPDAIPAAERQNLVNGNGETYPVGFFLCNWAASSATNILAATLVEEVLGYNTTLNSNDVGQGSVAGYYGVAGCRTPNDITDRGCNQGVTYYHVELEAWMAYPSDWDYIQDTYTDMAPTNLGQHGYNGLSTAYLPRAIQKQAYSTEGLSLDFYRGWNASWHQPSKYFGSISSIATSKLARCNETVMADDSTMRRYVKMTADVDGIIINNDVYSARCDDGYWWLPPSCRAATQHCVPWITGGIGWGVENFMQKFTLLNMPIGISIAAGWTDYTQVPLSVKMAFYWWAPDPTFLDLSPLVLKFAPHNKREYARGLYVSDDSSIEVATLVSGDLAVLAPSVMTFADNIFISLDQLNGILLDQKTTSDTWEEVTCRWIKANRAVWQSWIPDASECSPGFGLFDSVLEEFADVRADATNKIVCQACPPGTFSQKMEDVVGVTHICAPCGVGTSQSSGASLNCKPCKAGEYQEELRSTECKRCPFGTYQDQDGQVACKACPDSTNTLGLGSVAQSDCGCSEGKIDMNKTGAFDCTKCSEGMRCPALSSLVDLERGGSILGEQFVPKIKKGYFTTVDKPTEVFQCGSEELCPGGTPGSCAGGVTGTPCSHCAEGSTWTGRFCEDCAGWRQALWVLALIAIFAFLILAYYLNTSQVTAKASVLFGPTASFGMLVTSMQNLGLIGMMTVEWPAAVQNYFSVCQLLLLDIDSYGFSCIAGQSESVRYFLSVVIFPIGVAWLALGYAVSRLFGKKHRWEGPKVCSTMGAFLQVGFSTMSATSLTPMMCFKHPNGLRSTLKYPGVICGSAEHGAMLAAGSTLLVVFVLGFVAICTYAVLKVPSWSSKHHKHHLVGATRFLVYRFRLDSWWFGLPLLIRGPLVNLPVVLATDHPPIQVVCIATILSTVMVIQMLAWPWKVPLLNVTDTIVSFCIVLLVTTSALYLNTIDNTMVTFAQAVCTAMLGGLGLAMGLMVVMTVSALFYRTALGGKKEFAIFNLGKTPELEELAKKLKAFATELQKMEVDLLSEKFQELSVFDLTQTTTCITLLAAEVVPPPENPGSFRFSQRISSESFDPALELSRRSTKASNSKKIDKTEDETNASAPPEQKELKELNDNTEPWKTAYL